VKSVDAFVGLLLAEAEDTVLEGRVGVGERHIGEAGGLAFERLVLLLLDLVQLQSRVDLRVLLVGVDEVAPLIGGVHVVRHNLACVQLGVTIEDLKGSFCRLANVNVIHRALAADANFVGTNLFPGYNLVGDLALLESRWTTGHVKDLW